MNRYKITNKNTGEIVEKEAEYLGHAITATGWDEKDCCCEMSPDPGKADGSKKSRKVKKPAGGPKGDKPKGKIKKPAVVELGQKGGPSTSGAAPGNERFSGELAAVVIGEATEVESVAQKHKSEIEELAVLAEVTFLKMGHLLYDARIQGEWSILHYESYREYIEDLKLPMTNSYSWATRSIYEYLVAKMGLDQKLLAEIGVAKLTRLLPLARNGELTQEVIEAARILSDLDLRASLGHQVGDGGGEEELLVICPRCGEQFNANKASRP